MPKHHNKKSKGKGKGYNRIYTLTIQLPKGEEIIKDVDHVSVRDGAVTWKDPKTQLKKCVIGIPVCIEEQEPETPEEDLEDLG